MAKAELIGHEEPAEKAPQPQPPAPLLKPTQAQISALYPHLPGPAQVQEFYATMGTAIATWQGVENYLYEVYRACTRAQNPGAEACAFFSMHTFSTKLSLTNAAVRFTLFGNDILLAEWANIVLRAGKKSNKRNLIAHGSVLTMVHEKNPERKIYIGPNPSDPSHQIDEKKIAQAANPLTQKRVQGYLEDFRSLALQLGRFAHKIPQP